MPPDEYERFGQDDEPADDGLLNAQLPYTVVQTKSKWSIFTSPPDSESDEVSLCFSNCMIIAFTYLLGER